MADKYILTTFQFRRGLAENWKKNNPVLAIGEPGFERDTYRLKIGNGTTPWNELGYFGGSGILKRDNDYNYDANYIPQNGEVLLVDVAGQGLRIKVGDGSTKYSDLPYMEQGSSSSSIQPAYYHDGKLYTDNTYTTEVTPVVGVIYVDQATSRIYSTDGEHIGGIENTLPTASIKTAGIVKLYSTTGENTDGTMTQKAISDELEKKFSATIDSGEEILILNN